MLWLDGAQQGEIVLFLFHILLQIFVNKDSHLLFFYDTVYSGFFSAGKVTTLNRKHPKKLSRPPPHTHTHPVSHLKKTLHLRNNGGTRCDCLSSWEKKETWPVFHVL